MNKILATTVLLLATICTGTAFADIQTTIQYSSAGNALVWQYFYVGPYGVNASPAIPGLNNPLAVYCDDFDHEMASSFTVKVWNLLRVNDSQFRFQVPGDETQTWTRYVAAAYLGEDMQGDALPAHTPPSSAEWATQVDHIQAQLALWSLFDNGVYTFAGQTLQYLIDHTSLIKYGASTFALDPATFSAAVAAKKSGALAWAAANLDTPPANWLVLTPTLSGSQELLVKASSFEVNGNVPEPASLVLVGSVLIGLGSVSWRRRRT